MTIENRVICDKCGSTVKPPMNSGWAVVMITAPDGMNFSTADSHLCESCKVDFRRWLEAEKKRHAAASAPKPS